MTATLRVAINAAASSLGGSVTILRNVVPRMQMLDAGMRFTIVAPAEVASALRSHVPDVDWHIAHASRLGAIGRLGWEQSVLPLRLRKQADVLLCMSGVALAASPIPQVTVYQNVLPFHADWVSRANRTRRARFHALRLAGIASAHRSDRVVFISDYARSALLPQLGISDQKCVRIYLGHDSAFRPQPRSSIAPILQRHGLRRPYVLSVAHFYHYKQIVELVEAFELAAPKLPDDTELVLIGAHYEADYTARIKAAMSRSGLESRIRCPGDVSYDDLPAIYAGAELSVFASACENFPNILVESLASGTPTISSDVGPMREIAGDSAYYCDVYDPRSIADAIVLIWTDRDLRDRLGAAGVQRCELYSWDTMARDLLQLLRDLREHSARTENI